MYVQERIKRAQELMRLSDGEMAAALKVGEDEYIERVNSAEREFCEKLNTTFGISLAFLLDDSGPVFDWRALPISEIIRFRDERNWKQFHTPKDLAISISLEASELLECFQWSADDLEVEKKRSAMEEELADILIYAVSFADAIGADIPTIILDKLKKNGSKYTVDRSWGNATKYTDFEEEP